MKAPCLSCWKKYCLVSGMGMLFILSAATRSAGQCGNTLAARTYDTLLTGIGYGNYTVSIPQWNADSGLLLSVKLSAAVSLQYGFTLRNADTAPSIYTILVGRLDQISSTVMSAPYTNTTQQNIGVYPLSPGASVSRTPFALLKNYANTDSITGQMAPFIGNGSLSFAYSPITYTDISTNNNASYYYSASAGDSIHFSFTYIYCNSSVLASTLIRFAAQPEGANTVQLSWTMANEQDGRRYEVQESQDGQHFISAGSLPSVTGAPGDADYNYACGLPAGAQGKWYFRLKIDDASGASAYSGIAEVTLGSGSPGGLRLYPDPATDFVNIDLGPPGAAAGSISAGSPSGPSGSLSGSPGSASAGDQWQVELFSAEGRLLQRELYPIGGTVRLNFRQPLAPGAYFVRATDLRVSGNYTASFLIR